MKRIEKITAIGLLSLGILVSNITVYAKPEALPMESATVSVAAQTPACPRRCV